MAKGYATCSTFDSTLQEEVVMVTQVAFCWERPMAAGAFQPGLAMIFNLHMHSESWGFCEGATARLASIWRAGRHAWLLNVGGGQVALGVVERNKTQSFFRKISVGNGVWLLWEYTRVESLFRPLPRSSRGTRLLSRS